MECNRDEAKRSKEIAERKFSDKDIKGAKKFALKAQSLYPELDGISQLLAILDVYVAAENKINGESDFYGILGVNPLADEETVRKNYRKLALSLHPDKNKCIGAEGAFKHISEAWKFLSDKEKRLVYDRKMNSRLFKKKVNTHTQNGSSQQPTHNGFQRFTKSTAARTPTKTKDNISVNVNVNVKPTVTKTGPASVPSSSNEKITVKTFWTICTRCKLQYEFVRMYLNRNLICPTCHGPFHAIEIPPPNTNGSTRVEPGRGKSGRFLKPTSTAQAAAMVQQAYERVKREREEAQAVAKKEEASRRKKARKEAKLPPKQDVNGSDAEVKKDGSNEKRLINKATTDIKKKLTEWSSEPEPEPVPNGDPKKHENGSVLVDVPDPDFHDFDLDRTEKCFEQGQVWAAYDDHDEMPRSYAIIRKVISVDPFKMKICWLKMKPNKNSGQSRGFLEAYGEFKTGKQEIVSAPNYFSHKANFEKRGNGNVRVFPRKGDVCALYTIGQSQSQTSDLVTDKYEIVEIDEHDQKTGTTVTPLVKVAGFKTVFRRHLDPNQTRVVLEKEMFRFSHQIPSYLLTGLESPNAPKGCHELDPAAVPPEFLQFSENGKMDGGDECSKY